LIGRRAVHSVLYDKVGKLQVANNEGEQEVEGELWVNWYCICIAHGVACGVLNTKASNIDGCL